MRGTGMLIRMIAHFVAGQKFAMRGFDPSVVANHLLARTLPEGVSPSFSAALRLCVPMNDPEQKT
jgi:hypothetical protein